MLIISTIPLFKTGCCQARGTRQLAGTPTDVTSARLTLRHSRGMLVERRRVCLHN
jgi:hypothetical protein